jgi:ubiquinone/menaquinone biosynthesis C-methylase UbiE
VSQYLFDNAGPQTAQRFSSLATLYDPITARHLEALGVDEGWQCLEVGGGGGSIADLLARHVGARGHVLVTDIDPRHLTALETPGHANMTILRHDVERDPLPADTFDLIHARLVLVHLPKAEQTLHALVAALRPGGWLLIEDFDTRFADTTFPTADRAEAAVYRKVANAMDELLELHGSPRAWGRALYQRLQAEGLIDVEMEGHLAVWAGGTVGARMVRANFEQVRTEALQRELITGCEIEEALALLDDPTFAVSSPVMMSAWGRRRAMISVSPVGEARRADALCRQPGDLTWRGERPRAGEDCGRLSTDTPHGPRPDGFSG